MVKSVGRTAGPQGVRPAGMPLRVRARRVRAPGKGDGGGGAGSTIGSYRPNGVGVVGTGAGLSMIPWTVAQPLASGRPKRNPPLPVGGVGAGPQTAGVVKDDQMRARRALRRQLGPTAAAAESGLGR